MDRDSDYQNGRIANLEIKVDWLTNRMRMLGFAFTLTALAVVLVTAALFVGIMAGR